MHRHSDPELVALVARGDGDALAELYDRHGATAYAIALRVTQDAQLAEDVLQEAFLTVWRRARQFDPGRSRPSSWLMSITHHRAVDIARREHVRRTEPDDAMVRTHAVTNVPREVWRGIEAQQVRAALAALTGLQREVIQLSYFDGRTQSEVARLLHTPLGTIKSRTHVALSRLHEQLEQRGVTLEDTWRMPNHSR